MDELLEQFLLEGRELIQLASDALLAIERDGPDAERLASAYRAVHTLKGSSALFDAAPMTQTLHDAEDVLGAIRAGRAAPNREILAVLLDVVAASEAWLGEIGQSEGVLPATAASTQSRLTARLRACLGTGGGSDAGAAPETTVGPAPAWAEALVSGATGVDHSRTLVAGRYRPDTDAYFRGEDPLKLVACVPELLFVDVALTEGSDARARRDPFACCLEIAFLSSAESGAVRQAMRLAGAQLEFAAVGPAPAAAQAEAAPSRETGLRVDPARVDALIATAGELVVARNGLRAASSRAASSGDKALAAAIGAADAEIGRISARLQREAMALRLVPLSRVFRRMPRLVRDIAEQLGRRIRLEVSGGGIEADRGVVEGLSEPLLHLLRNAADHGIEPPEVRRAAGKPEEGVISLSAARGAGGRIVIAVADDGAGLDVAQLREAAARRGVAGQDELAAMPDSEVMRLIFARGFSTAAQVSTVSGRGMGMDAVRDAVSALGGTLDISGAPGLGCTVTITLPPSVLATAALVVQAGGARFGVPLDGVIATLRAETASPVHAGRAFIFRGAAVPLIRLSHALRLPEAHESEARRVLVIGGGDGLVGVEVDGIEGRADLVVRPLAGALRLLPGIVGAAVTEDGGVMTVLDLPALAA